jgi:hypothetical protein
MLILLEHLLEMVVLCEEDQRIEAIEGDFRGIEEVDLIQSIEVEVVISIKVIIVVLIIISEEVIMDHHKM